MDNDRLWHHVHTQRRALAEILADLGDDEWAASSLCSEWTVREVAAHVMRSPGATVGQLGRAIVRARGNALRVVTEDARNAARRPLADIVGDYEKYDGSRRRPPGVTVRDALLDVLVHTQDIVVPLGRSHAMPAEAAAAAAPRAYRMRFVFAGHRQLRGLELRATDTDLRLGRGELVQGTAAAVLLLTTGRTSTALPHLTGPGLARLR